MDNFYIVQEVQNNGTPAVLTNVYTDVDVAYQQYYTILAVAVVSKLPYHAAHIIRAFDGKMIEGKVYKRGEPEPPMTQE